MAVPLYNKERVVVHVPCDRNRPEIAPFMAYVYNADEEDQTHILYDL